MEVRVPGRMRSDSCLASIRTETSTRVERIFFVLASEYRLTFRKVAMTPIFYERCDRRSEFRVKESNSFNWGNEPRSLKRARLNDYEIFRVLKLKNERKV